MTPDRFERMVERMVGPLSDVTKPEAIMLLRRYHAAMRRLVKTCMRPGACRHPFQSQDFDNGYKLACDNFLAALVAKETP